jgi:hypothetical protein
METISNQANTHAQREREREEVLEGSLVIGEGGGGGGGGGGRSRIHGRHLEHGAIVGHHRPVLAAAYPRRELFLCAVNILIIHFLRFRFRFGSEKVPNLYTVGLDPKLNRRQREREI